MSSTPKPRWIMEGTVIPIRDEIKSQIASALANVRTNRGDAKVSTEIPKDYFIFDNAIGYKVPAIFVIGDAVDFSLDRGQNFIAAKVTVYVSALIDDRNAEFLAYKCWRYSDALHQILDQTELVSEEENYKNIIKVVKTEFSNTFQMKAQKPGEMDNPFRKEVMLTLEVEHLEKR